MSQAIITCSNFWANRELSCQLQVWHFILILCPSGIRGIDRDCIIPGKADFNLHRYSLQIDFTLFSSVLLGARCSFFLFRMSVSSYEVDSVSPCIFPCRKSNGCTNRNLWKWCHFHLLPSRALVFVKAVALLFAPESRTISQVGGWLGLARLLWLAVKKGNIF